MGLEPPPTGLTTATLYWRVTMATQHSTNATLVAQMSLAELSALAKRLRNRAESIVLRDQPEMQCRPRPP
jgi:4-diphosphocytidyl-2C-methyl-D-erythritol kinase